MPLKIQYSATWIICTYWLSGRAGRENIWVEVRTYGPSAANYAIKDLVQCNMNNMYLLTEWEGRTGKYLGRGQDVRTERSEVRAFWPRAKYFPVRPDLTQPISILSYDQFFNTFQEQNCFAIFFRGRTCFSGPITSTLTALIRELFSYGFPRKLRAGPYGSYDNVDYLTRIVFHSKRQKIKQSFLQIWFLFRVLFSVSNPLAYIRGKSFILSKSCKGWVKLVSEGLVKRKLSKARVQYCRWFHWHHCGKQQAQAKLN